MSEREVRLIGGGVSPARFRLGRHGFDAHLGIFTAIQFRLDRVEHLERIIHVFQGVDGGGDDTQDNHALRNNRVGNDRAEQVIDLAHIVSQLRCFGYATVKEYRGNAGVGFADIETAFAEAILNSVCLLYTSPSPRDVEESRIPY